MIHLRNSYITHPGLPYYRWGNPNPNSTALYFPASTPPTQQEQQKSVDNSQAVAVPVPKTRSPNWTDAETRHLLDLWRENYPISKRRNSSVWESIAKNLNQRLKADGQSNFRTGQQCKSRFKALEDEYKRIKDHNSRSGNDHETFDYYEELDVLLGCQHNIKPRLVIESGLGETASSADSSIEDEEEEGEENNEVDAENDSSSVADQQKSRGKTPKKPAGKGTTPKSKKRQRNESDLFEFLDESQKKDHEFFERLSKSEGERELKSQKKMLDTITAIAKIFKGDK